MKHSAIIVAEFDKLAAWDDYTQRRQRDYLRSHPGSRLRVNAPSSTGETCKNCGSSKLRVKDHGDWEGYNCPDCGQGGSRQKKEKKHFNKFRQLQQHPYNSEANAEIKREISTSLPEAIEAQAPVIDIKPEWYNKQSKTFAVELSEMGNSATSARTIYLKNPKTGAKVKFHRVGEDMDSTHEDTYGYRYENDNGDLKLLIIND
jgi:N-acetylmuramoyl-L-alanine amidase CwlA